MPSSIDEAALRVKVKAELRTRMRQVRKVLPAEARATRSAAIAAQVVALPEFESARSVMIFVPMRTEVDVTLIGDRARALGKLVAAPRMDEERAHLEVREWQAGVEPIEEGRMVREPPVTAPIVDDDAIDLVVVPALAVDERGARIGYGAGFYDRLLPRLTKAFRVAVAFDFQWIAEVPETPGDERVQAIATDRRLVLVVSPSA